MAKLAGTAFCWRLRRLIADCVHTTTGGGQGGGLAGSGLQATAVPPGMTAAQAAAYCTQALRRPTPSMSARIGRISGRRDHRRRSRPTSMPGSPSPSARTATMPPAFRCCSRSCAMPAWRCRRRRRRADRFRAKARGPGDCRPGPPSVSGRHDGLEAERIGDARPAAALDLGEERGVRALPDLRTEIDRGPLKMSW